MSFFYGLLNIRFKAQHNEEPEETVTKFFVSKNCSYLMFKISDRNLLFLSSNNEISVVFQVTKMCTIHE